jgi:hypothetical protein
LTTQIHRPDEFSVKTVDFRQAIGKSLLFHQATTTMKIEIHSHHYNIRPIELREIRNPLPTSAEVTPRNPIMFSFI